LGIRPIIPGGSHFVWRPSVLATERDFSVITPPPFQGITLEVAEDGLCRKYSLVLTLYTSGNLEGHLKKLRSSGLKEPVENEELLGRMLVWAYQVFLYM